MPILGLGHRPRPSLPPAHRARLPRADRPLGAVPVSDDGDTWALASLPALVLVTADRVVSRDPWDAVDRAAWDNGPRTFTVHWVDAARATTILTVPAQIRGTDVDVEDFARALRQRVESTIVHRVSGALPGGGTATVSVRRREDGSLGTATVLGGGGPDGGARQGRSRGTIGALSADDAAALAELEKQARDGVGLPTT